MFNKLAKIKQTIGGFVNQIYGTGSCDCGCKKLTIRGKLLVGLIIVILIIAI